MAGSVKFKPIVFSTADPFGNSVVLTAKTWEHIAGRHDEMAGQQDQVRKAIEAPDKIRVSTSANDVFAFEKTVATAQEIRVFIQYENPDFMKVKTTGKVDTAYPVDPARKPKIGQTIYVASASTAVPPAKSEEKKK